MSALARKVGLVIVNFNSHEETIGAVNSAVAGLADRLAAAVLVDNGCREGGFLAAAKSDIVEIVELLENQGFAAGVNFGVERALRRKPDISAILIMNPDARLIPGNWAGWVDDMNCDGGEAVVAPKIVSPDGRIQASAYGRLSPTRSLLEALGVHGIAERLGVRRAVKSERTQVDAVQGSCLLISTHAWKEIGPFDERFFLYHEEADWCYRAKAHGLKVIYDPRVTVVHEKGMSVPPGREEMYYAGLVLLVRKRFGDDYAEKYRRRLRVALGLSALMSVSRSRFRLLSGAARSV